ncbi:MAG: hypothetical protein K2X81_06575 [Candidatus Obscuribacterales bacterium]|nr:hypothetical protein [Candidatus Obscuribacterales bacterium]
MDKRRLGDFLRRLLFVGILLGFACGQIARGQSHEGELGADASNSVSITDSRAESKQFGSGHFELGAVRNEIWAPVKSTSILNGYAQRSRLEGGATTNFLQGNVSLDANGTALTTVQRLLHPRILSGYTMLKPQLSSGVFNDLSAQIAKSQPLMAEIANAKKEMDAQLAKAQPQLPNRLLPGIPKTDNANTVSPDLVAQLNRSHSTVQFDIAQAKMQMDAELARAKPTSGLGFAGRLATAKNTRVSLNIALPSTQVQIDSQIELASREMQSQLAHAKPSIGPDLSNDLNWQIYRGNKETQAEIMSAKPQLDAVYTKLRQAPQTATSINLSQPAVDANAATEKNILWDPWYARVARLYAPRLLQAMKRRGSPSGSNTITIKVWANHHLEATLIDADNSKFDDATLEAYRSLSGNAALQFPVGSHRQQVTFLIDNKHDSETPVSGINSQTYKGDKEIQGYKY